MTYVGYLYQFRRTGNVIKMLLRQQTDQWKHALWHFTNLLPVIALTYTPTLIIFSFPFACCPTSLGKSRHIQWHASLGTLQNRYSINKSLSCKWEKIFGIHVSTDAYETVWHWKEMGRSKSMTTVKSNNGSRKVLLAAFQRIFSARFLCVHIGSVLSKHRAL